MDKETWLKQRNKTIGGSDAAAILNDSPFLNRKRLFEIKTGQKEAEDISNKRLVKFGIEAEEPLRELFKLEHPELEVEHKDYEIVTNYKYKFAHASLDGALKYGKKKGILEIKTDEVEIEWQTIPKCYLWQLLHYLMVTEFDFAILYARLKLINDNKVVLKEFKVNRLDYLDKINYLATEEEKFYDEVVNYSKS